MASHGGPCSATRENLTKTLVKNENPKFSYRNNENDNFHHSRSSNKHVELVYTKYEVKRSIIKGCVPIQPDNPVFSTLTPGGVWDKELYPWPGKFRFLRSYAPQSLPECKCSARASDTAVRKESSTRPSFWRAESLSKRPNSV